MATQLAFGYTCNVSLCASRAKDLEMELRRKMRLSGHSKPFENNLLSIAAYKVCKFNGCNVFFEIFYVFFQAKSISTTSSPSPTTTTNYTISTSRMPSTTRSEPRPNPAAPQFKKNQLFPRTLLKRRWRFVDCLMCLCLEFAKKPDFDPKTLLCGLQRKPVMSPESYFLFKLGKKVWSNFEIFTFVGKGNGDVPYHFVRNGLGTLRSLSF